jgi:hypothetical protein
VIIHVHMSLRPSAGQSIWIEIHEYADDQLLSDSFSACKRLKVLLGASPEWHLSRHRECSQLVQLRLNTRWLGQVFDESGVLGMNMLFPSRTLFVKKYEQILDIIILRYQILSTCRFSLYSQLFPKAPLWPQ